MFLPDFSAVNWRGARPCVARAILIIPSHKISGDEGKWFTRMAYEVEIK